MSPTDNSFAGEIIPPRPARPAHAAPANSQRRIVREPSVLGGSAHFCGTRITVRQVVDALLRYRCGHCLLAEYPELDAEALRAAADYAARFADPSEVDRAPP